MKPVLKKALYAAGIIVILAAAYYAYNMFQVTEAPVLLTRTVGVPVYSKITLDTFREKKSVGLHTMTGKAETTCNFEISAVSVADRKGYDIKIERAPQEIVLDKTSAFIRGETDDEVLEACHAFVCLREGINCPNDLMSIKSITENSSSLILVVDNKSGSKAVIGYVELLGALGFIQAHLIDLDRNGIVDGKEINQSTVHIYPYIMQDDLCVLQPSSNALEKLNITNDTTKCSNIKAGIWLTQGDTNEISVDGRKIIVSGDEDHVRIASIIVRDVLSPEWIRFYYGMY